MKKTALFGLLATAAILNFSSCKDEAHLPDPPQYSFTVEPVTEGFTHAPALQSFAIGVGDNGDWLMFGGRTNGFHGFGATENFPFKKANYYIYAYDPKSDKLDSVATTMLPQALQNQFASTNMQCRQVGNYLYVCGGYGLANPGTADSAWTTYNNFVRIDISKMLNGVHQQDSGKIASALAWTSNDIAMSTGGELYQLPDGKFYLVVGHIFKGLYSNDTNNTQYSIQRYLDSVHVFNVNGTDSIYLNNFQYITDGLNDTITQFRRRDLVVTPNVLPGGKDFGISIYGGVFTYGAFGNPFGYPIYLTGGATPSYRIDSNFIQTANIYSAPGIVMYDDAFDMTMTTIFGGLGNDTATKDTAAFTKVISTITRSKNGTTSVAYNPTGMPGYLGAEAAFIRDAKLPMYNGNNLDIVDYRKMKTGDKQAIGYIYGGIVSNLPQWSSSNPTNPTQASNKVYRVYINKTL